ncbi:MAG: hypothetical protein CMJ31_01390 [Phycisphaerae bacterium]|nr:hypothetical protein [Phycisphaerae bacterium]
MYQALLTRKYLTSKVMPVLAMLAVTLSVGTVLVTWSVMGGFLETLLSTGRKLVGDVTVTWPTIGFAHYDDLIERLEADPEIEGAAPIIETFGLVTFPDDSVRFAQFKGVEGESFARVTGYDDSLWWRPLDEPTAKDSEAQDPRLGDETGYTDTQGRERRWGWDQLLRDGMTLTDEGRPAAVIGIAAGGFSRRTSAGIYVPQAAIQRGAAGGATTLYEFLPHSDVTISVVPIDSTGRPRGEFGLSTQTVPVANEFFTGLYEADSQAVLVNLDLLQEMLDMDEARRVEAGAGGAVVNPETGELELRGFEDMGIDPERVTSVLVRGKSASSREQAVALKSRVEEIYASFAADHAGEVPSPERIFVLTWREINATMIAAVEKETGLVLFVFGLVCFTTVFLVLAIFWSMVSEKTKDIGILRSVGASTLGVAWLWLRYGVAIGVVGSGLGTLGAWAVIANINEIHEWLGNDFGPWLSKVLTSVSSMFGGGKIEVNLIIWDPAVYAFTTIPTDMDWVKVSVVVSMGVLTCLLGAALPAYRAGRMDPVKALRFE